MGENIYKLTNYTSDMGLIFNEELNSKKRKKTKITQK
jgi:hypothetical protein